MRQAESVFDVVVARQSLEPEAYLIEVLKRLPHEATLDQAAALTPSRIAAEQKLASEQAV